MRQTPDEIVMLLELLDSCFKVNPGMEKRFGLTNELAKCADVSPILPKILFWTESGLSPFVSFEKCFSRHRRTGVANEGTKTVSG
ncbi:hypothetical protein [Klebsiella pneumoniae]|uniref:hypothetical protein n=1 Tax=Klebsiella pneumoniae TaxID=573 RepID=UPI001629BD14|nr:hypothetical protein [Klebsiella pneumoniae]